MTQNQPLNMAAIGIIHTPFQQKFAIPRQPNLAQAKGQIHFHDDYASPQAFKGIEGFSHLWLLFYFHETAHRGWKNAVKAPRLGGNDTIGVFASRSTHRPNSIGMSVVQNDGITILDGNAILNVSGVDLVNKTPILDIKPYLSYADAVSQATDRLSDYAPIPQRDVRFSDPARAQCERFSAHYPDLAALIVSVLAQDPRPAYKQRLAIDNKVYKVSLYNVDVSWQITEHHVMVLDISEIVE